MLLYALRRLLQFIPVIFFTLFLIHYITALGIQYTGNPVTAIFGVQQPPPSVLEAVKAKYHLDDPCLTQLGNPCVGIFADRIASYVRGDFGTDFNDQPVVDLLASRWGITARLATIAILFEAICGIGIGVLAALRKDGFIDNLVRASTTLLIAVPVFVLGVLVQLGVTVWGRPWATGQPWVPEPVEHIFSVTYNHDQPWLSLIIPGMVLGAMSLAAVARLTRTALIENINADYVRTGFAKGLRPRRVIGVHALRNSLIPVITYIGTDFGYLIGGAIVTEGIFNVPGIGGLAFQSAINGVVPVIVALVTILVIIFLLFNLLIDILYAVLDPRIRYG